MGVFFGKKAREKNKNTFTLTVQAEKGSRLGDIMNGEYKDIMSVQLIVRTKKSVFNWIFEDTGNNELEKTCYEEMDL